MVTVTDEIQPLRIDNEGVRIDEERRLTARDGAVTGFEPLLRNEPFDDVRDVIEPVLVEMRCLPKRTVRAHAHAIFAKARIEGRAEIPRLIFANLTAPEGE